MSKMLQALDAIQKKYIDELQQARCSDRDAVS